MSKILKELKDLVFSAKTCIVTSIDEMGYPTSRAMLTIEKRFSLGSMYFSTNTPSNKVKEFRKNSKASIYFNDINTFQGASFKGNIFVLEDLETKQYFWEDGDEQYYQKGSSDPDYCILKFEANEVTYYNNLKTHNFKL